MAPEDLERYLHQHIPMSQAMAVSVVAADKHAVILRAPLEPNINHRETVFGGSAAALATLAAWSLLHIRLRNKGDDARLVIHRSTMEYERPITGAFTARSELEDPKRLERFSAMLSKKGRGRIVVESVLEQGGQRVGTFSGEFVALQQTEEGKGQA